MVWREQVVGAILGLTYEFGDLPEYRFYYFHRYLGTDLAEVDWLWAERKKLLSKSSP